jgi:hypothetical protein
MKCLGPEACGRLWSAKLQPSPKLATRTRSETALTCFPNGCQGAGCSRCVGRGERAVGGLVGGVACERWLFRCSAGESSSVWFLACSGSPSDVFGNGVGGNEVCDLGGGNWVAVDISQLGRAHRR